MKKNLFHFLVLILIYLLPSNSEGKEYYKYTATTAAQFLKLGVSPRAAALGDAFSAIANDAYAPAWNPAGLGYIYQSELQLMHSEWLGGTQYEFMGYVSPSLWGCLGINLLYFHIPEMNRIEDGVLKDKIQIAEGMASFSYGKSIFDFLSFGFNIKGIQSMLDKQKSIAYAADVGILIKTLREEVAFAIVGQNYGTKLKYFDTEFKLPETVRAGLAFKLDLPQQYTSFRFTGEVIKSIDSDYVASVGIENIGASVFALRVGYVYPLSDHKLDPLASVRAGLGLNINGFLIDYAYTPFGSLEYTHRASLGFKFVGWKTEGKKLVQSVGIIADPDNISPNADNIKEETNIFTFLNNIKEVKSWKLEITDSHAKDKKNTIIKTFEEEGSMPLSLAWNGFKDDNKLVSEGKYKLVLEVVNEKSKKLVSPEIFVNIDLTPPEVQMRFSTGTFSPDGDKINDTLTVYPRVLESNGISIWQLAFASINQPDKMLKVISSTRTIPSQIIWNGDDEFQRSQPNGKYIVQFTVEDKAGNRSQTAMTTEIYVPALELGLELATTYFSPNNDGLMDVATFYLSAKPEYRIGQRELTILTSAEKNVRTYRSGSADESLVWDGTDDYYNNVVPNGKYIVRLTVVDTAGNKSYTEKEIVVNVPPKIVEKEPLRVKDAVITEEDRGTVIQIMADLLFQPKTKSFQPGSYVILDDVAKALNKNLNKILIEGHTDSVGTVEETLQISSERAWAVFSYLSNSGVDTKRMTVKGRGKEKPIASNKTSAGRARNQRIEIIILK